MKVWLDGQLMDEVEGQIGETACQTECRGGNDAGVHVLLPHLIDSNLIPPSSPHTPLLMLCFQKSLLRHLQRSLSV